MSASQIRGKATRRPRGGIAVFLSSVSLAFGLLHFVRLRSPEGERFLMLRVAAAALAPIWTLLGLLGAVLGAQARRPKAVVVGLGGLLASAGYMRRVAAVTPAPADGAFKSRIPPVATRDVIFATTVAPQACGGGDRPLYCDVWQPAPGSRRSGLGLVYLHGSGWYLGDKGGMTTPMLREWAANGHVVMDVAYRLCPETDLRGMLADAWTAIAWLKAHAQAYEIDPARVVLAGTSAGGHVALLAAYTADQAGVFAKELEGQDVSVRGVFTVSAPIDVAAMLRHHPDMLASANPPPGAAYHPLTDLDPVLPLGPNATRRERLQWQRTQMRRMNGLLRDLLGGGPLEAPEMFAFASVGAHVRPGLPATLIIQGDQDVLVPVQPARDLYWRLQEVGVHAAYLELPQTDHAFEVLVPQISPPARAAAAAIKQFLADL